VRWRPQPRKRVGFKDAFKKAGDFAFDGAQSDPWGGAPLIATVVFGIWWRVAGIPQPKADEPEPSSPDSKLSD
jgi:hypothetical protein